MAKKLIIVESPAKAKTLGKFLGNEYVILASLGHVRDLPSKNLGFDPEQDFEPVYEVSKGKTKVIQALKKEINAKTLVYFATDEDREGEAISWHLLKTLKISPERSQRIVFHEITKSAILEALKNPRQIDQQLVDAQQARRILDRAVGYELSPLLWKKVKPGLSAGRVQSVAARIIVDRERDIRAFIPEEYWKIKAHFENYDFQAELKKYAGKVFKVRNEAEAKKAENSIKSSKCEIIKIDERAGKRNPSPPFTTSTLQQEASIKHRFSVKHTMAIAQQLYEGSAEIPDHEGGLITYMRTDSVTLSEQCLQQARTVITDVFGKSYVNSKPRKFTTKSKGAQEAHEAIRPVDLSKTPESIQNYVSSEQFRLYDLIWKRTIASQMKAANFANTTVRIESGTDREYQLETKGQRMVFAGFLKAYNDGENTGSNKDILLPELKEGEILDLKKLNLEQLFTLPPARYTEASLVKKLESEGIGRPSTYAPTISVIQDRNYVEKNEDKRLQPTDIGEVVTDFLIDHFPDIVDMQFTSKMEGNFDLIAEGKEQWAEVLKHFYFPFHDLIADKEKSISRSEVMKERVLGEDPESGKPIAARMGRFGPIVQIGTRDDEEKPKFAPIPESLSLNDITLEQALKCFELPRTLGNTESGEEILVNRGRYGPYVKVGSKFFSIKDKEDDPMTISLERALEVVKEAQLQQAKNTIAEFGEIQVLNGRYGAYIKFEKKNYKIPKGIEAESLDQAACEKIIAEAPAPKKKRAARKKTTTAKKKTAAKKKS